MPNKPYLSPKNMPGYILVKKQEPKIFKMPVGGIDPATIAKAVSPINKALASKMA